MKSRQLISTITPVMLKYEPEQVCDILNQVITEVNKLANKD